ncbi:N-acetylmuramoyl-L-alanine amidase [Ectobacillus panaciterrae]|uniref:N-acetylmuramoyl-L-alanine amidase n=1 Tax=Ectobacillus panaciterrae TaxID=363872 RepID=UPI000425FF9E|nr:N-acetylmuramoyl-L-alanine amidase [Ectobacillus panaciterrae]
MKLVIDPGHGGTDTGAVGNGLQEKNLTLQIAKRVRDIISANYEVDVKMTRETDVYISLSERTSIANSFGADYFISIHINAGGGTGYEDYIYSGLSDSSFAAGKQQTVHNAVVSVLPKYSLPDRGRKKADYAVLRETAMDAILCETAFIDSSDANLLQNPQFIEDMSQAYARGVAEAMGLNKQPNPTPQPAGPIGIANILGTNINLRTGPSTSSTVIRKLNSPESYLVYAENNGWLDLGAGQWVYCDPSYIEYLKYGNPDGSPIGVVDILGNNINLRTGPSTSAAVIRKLNSPESYLAYAYKDGWFDLGTSQWVYYDRAYIKYKQNSK